MSKECIFMMAIAAILLSPVYFEMKRDAECSNKGGNIVAGKCVKLEVLP